MGLPRNQRDELQKFFDDSSKASFFMSAIHMGRHAGYHGVVDKVLKAKERADLTEAAQTEAIAKWAWKHIFRPDSQSVDELTRMTAPLYIGLERRGHSDQPSFREVEIPRYFRARLELENKRREEQDRQALALRERIKQFRGRVYASRTFPVTLKAIIFERDNYTCRLCLRDRVQLQQAGLHLQCDHILAWEDGGLTTYDNGQTVCNGCNTAKHHAKTYLGLVARLKAS